MIARSTVLGLVILAVFCSPAFAQSFYNERAIESLGDDAGTVDAPAIQDDTQEVLPALRIALPGIRAIVTARRMVNNNQIVTIYNKMEEKLQEINTREKTVIPYKSLHHLLSPIERRQQAKCWVDAACLAQVLDNKGIDIAVASKLSNNMNNQLLLLVRIVDVKTKRTLREFLVQEVSADLLGSSVEAGLHKALVDLKLISKEEEVSPAVGAVAPVGPASTLDQLSTEEKIQESDHKRPIGMTVAKWTTLGAGIVALVAGTTFSVIAVQNHENAKAGSSPAKVDKYNKDAELNALSANISFGFGAALLISSVVLFVLDVEPDEGIAADGWTPTIGPMDENGGAAIMLQGTF